MTHKRPGVPRKKTPAFVTRSRVIQVSLSKKELDTLNLVCDTLNISRSEFVRNCINDALHFKE